jgi:hypothetical protein
VFPFTHHHSEKGSVVEFQDAFSEMVVPFAEMAAGGCNAFVECGRTRKVTIFSPGRMMIAESRTEQID